MRDEVGVEVEEQATEEEGRRQRVQSQKQKKTHSDVGKKRIFCGIIQEIVFF